MFVIGDVHGCFKTLEKLYKKIKKYKEPICFVGDLIDRGPMSKEVVDFVKDNGFHCVKGNHEDMCVKSLDGDFRGIRPWFNIWIENGGRQTKKSFTHNDDEKGLLDYKEWFENLPVFIEFPDKFNDKNIIVSHSLLFPYWNGKTKEFDEDKAFPIMWERWFNYKSNFGKFNVIGHTPHKNVIINADYVIIDTGCVYVNYKKLGYGKLTAARIYKNEIKYFQEECIDDV